MNSHAINPVTYVVKLHQLILGLQLPIYFEEFIVQKCVWFDGRQQSANMTQRIWSVNRNMLQFVSRGALVPGRVGCVKILHFGWNKIHPNIIWPDFFENDGWGVGSFWWYLPAMAISILVFFLYF